MDNNLDSKCFYQPSVVLMQWNSLNGFWKTYEVDILLINLIFIFSKCIVVDLLFKGEYELLVERFKFLSKAERAMTIFIEPKKLSEVKFYMKKLR